MSEQGTITEDLRRHHTRPPSRFDVEEQKIQASGGRAIRIGVTICVGFNIISLATALVFDGGLFRSGPSELFAVLGYVSMMVLGGSFVGAGYTERRDRAKRAMLRAVLDEQDRQAAMTRALREDVHERHLELYGVVAPLAGRIAELEERLLPIEEALTVLAERLPDELLAAHWRGFNEAVREGFGEKTGTDNRGRRRHIGLVPQEPCEPGE